MVDKPEKEQDKEFEEIEDKQGKEEKKEVKKDIEGDVTESNISNVRVGRDANITGRDSYTAGRDLHVHRGNSQEKPDLPIYQREYDMVKLGRILLTKLGPKAFWTIFGTLLIGSGGTFSYYLYATMYNKDLVLFAENFNLLIAIFIIFIATLSFLGYGTISRCEKCHNIYAKVPIRRKLINQYQYRGKEHNEVETTKKCEICGDIHTEKDIEVVEEDYN